MIGLNLHFLARLTLAAINQISYELLKIIFVCGELGPFRGTDGAGNTKGGSITVPLTSCLTCLDLSVLQIKTESCQLSHS